MIWVRSYDSKDAGNHQDREYEFVVAIKRGGVGVAVRCIAPRPAPGGDLCVIHRTATKNPYLWLHPLTKWSLPMRLCIAMG